MKNLIRSLATLAILVFLSSCGVNNALILNHNQNATQVHLSGNNYEIIDKVSGSADVSYVLIFGGLNKTKLYENAYSEMVSSADLSGSKALVNILTEEHLGGFPPFYYTRTVTVSAHVIEFTR
ncbi:MAG: DUF6567 family protein [Cyclobacteriaceae bacterium]